MKARLFHALLAASMATAVSAGASALVLNWVPEGHARRTAERLVAYPGQLLYRQLHQNARVEKLVDSSRERLEAEEKRLPRIAHLYNVGVWTAAGFALCLLMTLVFGISSIKEALVLGFRVTLTLIFLQGALVLGAVLALRRLSV